MAKVARGLPNQIAAGIGRIIALWSEQEVMMQLILKNATGTQIKTARIALRQPAIEEYPTVLQDVLFVEGLAPRQNIRQLGKQLKDAKERRDLLAHSLWVRDSGELGIQWIRGTPDHKPWEPRVTRKMRPQFKPMDATYLRETREMISATLKTSRELNDEILRLRKALQEGLRTRAAREYLQSQIQAAPKRPRRSSPA
jgi:hypothetical protein